MTRPVMLDTGPLGRIAHPKQDPEIINWLYRLVDAGVPVLLPEIADYELRRSFLLENLAFSLSRLDRLKESLIYLPLTTEVMLLAAQLWAYEKNDCRQPMRKRWIVMSSSVRKHSVSVRSSQRKIFATSPVSWMQGTGEISPNLKNV